MANSIKRQRCAPDNEEGGATAAAPVVLCLGVCCLDHNVVVDVFPMPHAQRVRELVPADVTPRMLDGVALLHLDGRHSLAAAHAAELARDRGVPVLVEAELRSGVLSDDHDASLAALLRCADYVVTSEHYPCQSTGKTTVEAGLSEILASQAHRAHWAVATLGERGCVAVSRCSGNSIHSPAFRVDVVETTGAGDAFIGGLAYGIVHGIPLERALSIACWVAAQKCRGEGTRSALPTLEQLKEATLSEPRLQVMHGA